MGTDKKIILRVALMIYSTNFPRSFSWKNFTSTGNDATEYEIATTPIGTFNILLVRLKSEIDPVFSVDAIEVKISAVNVDIERPSVRGIDVFTIAASSENRICVVSRGMNPILASVGTWIIK
jgi:hypothetical protein